MNKNVALVLSGGGARGLAHIGVIEVLEERGYTISSISGTSMGSLIGAVYAVGNLEKFKTWVCALDELDIFHLIDFTFSSHGLIKGDRVFNKLKQLITTKKIEDLDISYSAIATNIVDKKEVIFRKGNIYSAVRASVTIPTVLTPRKYDGVLLVDGGILNNIPVNRVKRTKNDFLVAVNVNADIPVLKLRMPKVKKEEQDTLYLKQRRFFKSKLRSLISSFDKRLGYFHLLNDSFSILMSQVSNHTLEKFPPDVLIEVSNDSCGIFDFYKARELIEIGRQRAIKAITAWEKSN